MKRTAVLLAGLLFLGAVPARAKGEDPQIEEYLEGVKQNRREEARKENKEKRHDPHRRLRPYLTLDEIYRELDALAQSRPNLVTVFEIGRTREGNPIKAVRFSTGPQDKAEMLYLGNIHAQELAGGMVCLAIVRYLAERAGHDCYVDGLLAGADLYVVPVLNPDRMAKAAKMQSRYGATWFIRKNAGGVDLNRNYPYPPDAPDRLKASAGSPRPRSMTHRGPQPVSEPETQALLEFIGRHHFVAVHSYHTSGGMIMYPPGTFPERTPDDALFQKMAEGYRALQFDPYRVHPEIDLYPTIGALDDYLYHRYGILATTVELGKRAQLVHRPTVFYFYNVYELDREIANNLMPALSLAEWAIRVHQDPTLRQWQPEETPWVGEP